MDPVKTGSTGSAGGAFGSLVDAFLQYQTLRMQTNAASAQAAAAAQAATVNAVEQGSNVNARPLSAAELMGLTGDQYSVPWYVPAGLIAAGALTAYLIFGR